MRLLHYLEIENFKRFGAKQRIELDHPGVLIGPNNCGKTSAIQALALWSQAVRAWYDARKGNKDPLHWIRPLPMRFVTRAMSWYIAQSRVMRPPTWR